MKWRVVLVVLFGLILIISTLLFWPVLLAPRMELPRPQDLQMKNIDAVESFFESLTATISFGTDTIATVPEDLQMHYLEDAVFWSRFVYADTIRFVYRPPDVSQIINRPLTYEGQEIIEEEHRKANGRIGWATCEEGRYKIYYAKKKDRRISPECFVFFREHEFAHIKLGHVSCDRQSSVPTLQQREIEADCEAVRALVAFGHDGVGVIYQAVGTLRGMNYGRAATHPASVDRADHIDAGCR